MTKTTTTERTGTIERLTRRSHSRMGNPAFTILLTDGTTLVTSANAAISYEIENPEYRDVLVIFTLTKAGRVTCARVA